MVLCNIMISRKKKRGQANVPVYAAPCCSSGHRPVPMSLHLCNFEIQLQNYINHVVVHIFRDVFLCPVPLIPVLLSFLPLSPLGTFLFGRRWSSRRTGNIPSSWYKRWRWTQFATAIIVSKGTGDRPDICCTLLLFGTRTCPPCPRKESLSSGVLPSRQMFLIEF